MLSRTYEGFKITKHIIGLSIFLSALIWVGEAIVKNTTKPEGTIIQEIFTPEIHDLWMRLISVSILIIFGILTQRLVSRSNSVEAALRESEQKYRSFIETLTDIVFTLDVDGNFTYMNPYSETFTKIPVKDIIGRSFTEIVAPEYHELAFDRFERGLAGEKTPMYEAEIITREGNRIPIEVNVISMLDDQGKAIGRIGVARDITGRKQVETALRESEEKFRVLAESTPTAIMLYQDDRWIYANPAAEKISGYTEAELKTMTFWDIVHPDYKKMIQKRGESRQKGLPVERRYEFRIISKDGRETWVDLSGAKTIYGGKPAGIISVMDITDRKLSEQAIRESEEKYRTILESIEEGYFELDLEGNFVFFNDSMCKIIGYSREKLTGINYRSFTPKSIQRTILRKALNIYKTGKPEEILDYEFVREDDSTGSIEMSLSLIFDSTNNPIGYRGIARDNSERKRLEAQLLQAQKMEALGTLAGGIAHDFNNLLMAIQGNTSLIKMDIDDKHPHAKRVQLIEQCIFSGSELTKQLLGFARGGKYEVKPTDLNEIIQKTSEMFGHAKKEIKIHRKLKGNLWNVEVDQGQIEQVLLNMYVNAWQAMPGGGELFLETTNVSLDKNHVQTYQTRPGKYVKISVADTGVGMDEATMARIFDPFFTTKDMSRGSGLGLASAYGIIRNHEGIINVYSEKGRGSTFNIFLPASDKKVVPDEESADTHILKGNETVFLIDDENMIIEIGSDILERLGYEVLTASSGEQALEIFSEKSHQIDIVILDMIMPGIGGAETYDRLKNIRDDVKVILSSGYSMNGHAANILARGCNGFIQKPFDIKTLSLKIREILD